MLNKFYISFQTTISQPIAKGSFKKTFWWTKYKRGGWFLAKSNLHVFYVLCLCFSCLVLSGNFGIFSQLLAFLYFFWNFLALIDTFLIFCCCKCLALFFDNFSPFWNFLLLLALFLLLYILTFFGTFKALFGFIWYYSMLSHEQVTNLPRSTVESQQNLLNFHWYWCPPPHPLRTK